MKEKTVSSIITLLLISILTSIVNISPVKASGTIYIRPDGSIEPDTAPIQRDGDLYTFISSIYDSIVVQRDNIVVDGAGYGVWGTHTGIGIDLSSRSNVTIKDMGIGNFYTGILLDESVNNSISGDLMWSNGDGINLQVSSNNSILGNNIIWNGCGIRLSACSNNNASGNNITGRYEPVVEFGISLYESVNNSILGNNISWDWFGIQLSRSSNNNVCENNVTANDCYGIALEASSNNKVFENNITENIECGIFLLSSSNNLIFHNNFIDNKDQASVTLKYVNVWDDGYPSGGNYWSDYTDVDLYCGPGQNTTGSDGIWDHPYVIDAYNKDNYPLVNPYILGNLTVSIYTDKYTYHKGDVMQLGLSVTNPDSVKYVCFAIYLELPDGSKHLYMHKHSILLAIGLDYSNPSFRKITLPNLPKGIYTWHAAFLERATHTIIVEDTAQWEFV